MRSRTHRAAAPRRLRRADRIQTGIRIERRLLKVVKALAEYMDVSLGEMIEVMLLQGLDGTCHFSKGTLRRIGDLKRVYDLDDHTAKTYALLFTRDK